MNFTPEEENEWSCAHPEMVIKELPEGVYDAKLTGFKAIERKSDGAKSFVLKYKILSGEHAFKTYEHYLGLSTGGAMLFAKSQLELLGAINPGDKVALSQVESLGQSCVGRQLAFEVYDNKGYKNCKILRQLAESETKKDEDVPF